MSDSAGSTLGAEALSAELKLLKGHIMAEIEAKLSQNEDVMWRRGQAEIQRLKQDQQQVLSSISIMQEREANLIAENQKIRGTLQKFEHVVQEMREVLGTLISGIPARTAAGAGQHSPSPSVASTATSEARDGCGEGAGESLHAVEKHASWSPEDSSHTAQSTPVKMWPSSQTEGGATPVVKGLEEDKTFCTPPRSSGTSLAAEDPALLPSGVPLPVPPSWRSAAASSPAVLSLASVLSAAALQTPTPPPALKKLQLADCLDQSPETTAASSPAPRRRSELSVVSPAPSSKQEHISLELVKEEGFQTLGIEVNQVEGSLVVDSIDEHGLVGYWNNRRESNHLQILIGDRIIEVNGIKQDSKRMLHECKVRQRLNVVLARNRAVSADSPLEAGSPPRKLRPEAQVFVPSGQKEGTVSAAPPGLEYEVPGMLGCAATSLLATTPQLLVGDHCDLLSPLAEPFIMSPDQHEVKRALFP